MEVTATEEARSLKTEQKSPTPSPLGLEDKSYDRRRASEAE